jgi:deoxyribodipyrimidine photo-lyase
MTTLLWFRADLRLADNPALANAVTRGEPVVPVFILDDEDAQPWAPGGASRWWLHGSLEALDRDLRELGGPGLILRRGPAEAAIATLVAETGANAVVWNRRYEPWAVTRDARIKAALRAQGVEARSFNATLLCEPTDFANLQGQPYKVFTPFWKTLRATILPPASIAVPKHLPPLANAPAGDPLESWALRPAQPDWAGGLDVLWTPGEAGARARLDDFIASAMLAYRERRNLPGEAGTSRLSPHLHFGEIGPWQVWRATTTAAAAETGDPFPAGVETFLSELAWREFAAHLLFHFPTIPVAPLRPEYAHFPWRSDPAALIAWQKGLTGYPIVDAGMRELWATGWMHNRVRMIVASFLIKHLLLDWRDGEAWFWDTLVDADLASNAVSWQWVAGSGADAAPYFRIFNPITQGEKFDADGVYVRRWAPELARLPNSLIHAPWTASALELSAAGVRLGVDYPHPIVEHALGRARALAALASLKAAGSAGPGKALPPSTAHSTISW